MPRWKQSKGLNNNIVIITFLSNTHDNNMNKGVTVELMTAS